VLWCVRWGGGVGVGVVLVGGGGALKGGPCFFFLGFRRNFLLPMTSYR